MSRKRKKRGNNKKTPVASGPHRSQKTGRRWRGILFAILLSIGAIFLALKQLSKERHYERKHATFAHDILDLERKGGFAPEESHYQRLDGLIDTLVVEIASELLDDQRGSSPELVACLRNRAYTRAEVITLLKTINSALIKSNFVHRNSGLLKTTLASPTELDSDILHIVAREATMLTDRDSALRLSLSEYIPDPSRREKVRVFLKENNDKIEHIRAHPNAMYHYTDCYNTTAIYLAVADVLDLPLRPVNAPNHAFVRWHFTDKDYLDWEVTRGLESNDTSYMTIARLDHNGSAVRNGIYLRSLTRSEALGVRYILMGNIRLSTGRAQFAQGDVSKAKASFQKALGHFQESLQANPRFTVVHNNIGMTYEYLGDVRRTVQADHASLEFYAKALDSYKTASASFPENAQIQEQVPRIRRKIRHQRTQGRGMSE